MKIKRLRIINFKKFTEEQSFEFSDNNLISGQNGSGKTAIKDAILFCLYNRTQDGSLSDSSKYISSGKNKCLAEVVVEIDGKEHTIRRERTEKQTKITYLDGSQSDEDAVISQETLETIIPSFKDFSAVFNIGWFMLLDDREKRDYILSITPEIDRNSIFNKLGGKEEYIEKYDLDLEDLIGTHKKILARKRDNIDEIDRLKGFLLETEPIEIPEVVGSDMSEKIKELKAEEIKYQEYLRKKDEYDSIIRFNKNLAEENNKIKLKIDYIKLEEIHPPTQENINSLKLKIKEYEKQISLPAGNCPTCHQAIDDRHRDKVSKINDANKKLLEEAKVSLDKEIALYNTALEKWNNNEEKKNEVWMLKTKFQDPKIVPKEPANIVMPENITKLYSEQAKYIESSAKAKALEEQEKLRQEKISKCKIRVKSLGEENLILIRLADIFSPRGIQGEEMTLKLEPIKEQFKKLIPEADIVTLEMLKNEMGYKEVFKILLGDKEYSKLSLGEKTRVDISLSQIINSMLEKKIDMFFLDNSEVLDSSVSLPKQAFICKVTNQQFKLN